MCSVFSTNNNNLNLLTKTVIPINSLNTGVIYNGSYYLIGGNSVTYSSDSVNWASTPISISGMTTIKNFAWNNPSNGIPKIQPLTIACGEGTNTLAYSPDGIYWKGLGKTIFSDRSNKALWNGTMWVAVGRGNYCIASSYDGVLWTGQNSTILDEGYDIAWNGSMFIAVGTGGSEAVMSSDGITWYGINSLAQLFNGPINSIQWTGKIWLATGSGSNTTAYSNDGYIWQSTNPKNLIITDASNVFSDASVASSVTSSSITSSYLATYVSDNSMNPTSSTEWRSNTNLYNASTGVYTGTSSTNYNNIYTVNGEWLQINAQQPLNIVYYHLSWYIDVSSSYFTVPSQWYLFGSSINNGGWTLIDYFNYGTSSAPINVTSNKFLIKLQNIYSNTTPYQYYRFVFPSLFPGGSLSYIRVSELDLFYENANSTTINRYIKPIVTPTHILYQTNIIPFSSKTGKQIVYQVTDLCGNIVKNNTINNGCVYNSIINGAYDTCITSGCFDGENYIITPMNGNVCYMNTQSLNTNFNFDISVNSNVINRNISGNVYSSCFNGKRIVLGGTGGNVISYSPIMNKNPNGIFSNSLNADSFFTSVYCVASNSGYGPLYIPNRLYFNQGENLSIVSPKAYNKCLSGPTQISMTLNNYVPQTNVSIPINTIVYGSSGPSGEIGIAGPNIIGSNGNNGDAGFIGLQGLQGSDGNPGSFGPNGMVGLSGLNGVQGPTGPEGSAGIQGFTGFDGLFGPIGPTGPKEYGPVDEKLWKTNPNKITTNGNIFISSTNTSAVVGNALSINGDLKTNNTLYANQIQSNNSVVAQQCIVGKPLSLFNPHPYILFDISGHVSISNKLVVNTPISSNLYSCDVSGNVYANKLIVNNTIVNYLVPTNISSYSITIDINKSNIFYVDVGTTLSSNFTCILNNIGYRDGFTSLKFKLVLDYTNSVLNRYFCKFLNINGFNYDIRYTQGDPSALFSNSIATNKFIQNITIIYGLGGGIWKVICDSLFYSS
jgi:hypothetical protein